MKKNILLMTGLVGLTSALQLSQAQEVMAADKKIKVVTTFYPVYEFTKHVVGNEGDVSLLMKAGVEPHDFEPSTKDVKKIQDADALVYMDDNMETWIPKVKKSTKSGKVEYIEGTGDMLLVAGSEDGHAHEESDKKDDHDHKDHDHEGHSHAYDPHVWLSPYRSISVVESISQQLAKKHPEKAEAFKANAKAYIEELKKLRQRI
ncbi:ABC transporter, substrate-binding protein [Streptococcus iniae SF1]|nr:ABC transporter, substrate-binding protein [Streptococcus iniae SF1]